MRLLNKLIKIIRQKTPVWLFLTMIIFAIALSIASYGIAYNTGLLALEEALDLFMNK